MAMMASNPAGMTEELMTVWRRMTARWTAAQLRSAAGRRDLLEGVDTSLCNVEHTTSSTTSCTVACHVMHHRVPVLATSSTA